MPWALSAGRIASALPPAAAAAAAVVAATTTGLRSPLLLRISTNFFDANCNCHEHDLTRALVLLHKYRSTVGDQASARNTISLHVIWLYVRGPKAARATLREPSAQYQNQCSVRCCYPVAARLSRRRGRPQQGRPARRSRRPARPAAALGQEER